MNQPLADYPLAQAPRSRFETACRFVPILGWIIAIILESRRRDKRFRYIRAQLVIRSDDTNASWGEDPKRRMIAEIVCREIQSEFVWPNAFYIPEDPLELLFLVGFEKETVFVFMELELRLGVELINDTALTNQEFYRMTLGQFVDYLTNKPRLRG